jgi:hypothetical protein
VLPFTSYDSIKLIDDERPRQAEKRRLLKLATRVRPEVGQVRVVLVLAWARLRLS